MPTPKQLANLTNRAGRPPSNKTSFNVTIDNSTLDLIDRICEQQGWKRSYVVNLYLKKAFGRFEIEGYNLEDLELIAKGAPIE